MKCSGIIKVEKEKSERRKSTSHKSSFFTFSLFTLSHDLSCKSQSDRLRPPVVEVFCDPASAGSSKFILRNGIRHAKNLQVGRDAGPNAGRRIFDHQTFRMRHRQMS